MKPLEKGQKVILRNGVTGKIADVDEKTGKIVVRYDPPFDHSVREKVYRTKENDDNFEFYLLGKNLYKNKISEYELRSLETKLEYLTNARNCVRKQLFNLNERMVDDWRERQGKKD